MIAGWERSAGERKRLLLSLQKLDLSLAPHPPPSLGVSETQRALIDEKFLLIFGETKSLCLSLTRGSDCALESGRNTMSEKTRGSERRHRITLSHYFDPLTEHQTLESLLRSLHFALRSSSLSCSSSCEETSSLRKQETPHLHLEHGMDCRSSFTRLPVDASC